MTNTLILIRHSQSQPQPDHPASQWPLTEEGHRRCLALAERLAAYVPHVIVTSRERKAAETGALVAAQLGIPAILADGLHEHLREHVGWLPNPAFEQAVAAFFAHPIDAALHNVLTTHPERLWRSYRTAR